MRSLGSQFCIYILHLRRIAVLLWLIDIFHGLRGSLFALYSVSCLYPYTRLDRPKLRRRFAGENDLAYFVQLLFYLFVICPLMFCRLVLFIMTVPRPLTMTHAFLHPSAKMRAQCIVQSVPLSIHQVAAIVHLMPPITNGLNKELQITNYTLHHCSHNLLHQTWIR